MSTEVKPPGSGPGGEHRRGHSLRRLPRGFARIAFAHSDGTGAAKLGVPAALARMVGTERIFRVELTEEGILYRYVEGGEPVGLPAWLLSSERGET